MSERLLALALHLERGYGFSKYKRLVEEFGSLALAYKEGVLKVSLERAREEIEKVDALGFKVITVCDDDYPHQLLLCPSPPLAVYLWGKLPEGPFVSIVGSRRCSDYGRRVAYSLGKFLSERGVTVVSGLALGIDSSAHKGALAGGRTVAVLGSSLDRLYPRSNLSLAKEIVVRGGSIISEFPLGTGARREYFPRRNRIIGALCEVLIVVEARERSGTFITVNYALDMGKEVLAVPGNIDSPFSKGTNRLIKEGAPPLLDFSDVFDYLNVKPKAKKKRPDRFEDLYALLESSPLSADEISVRLGKGIDYVNRGLTYLEVMGLIKREGLKWHLL